MASSWRPAVASGVVVMSTLLACSWWLRRGLCAEGILAFQCFSVSGTCVVHAQSPLTIVASRCTWVPRISANASRSVSHSSGNSSATCDTGQWCWHSWMPWIGPAHRRRGGRVAGLRQRGRNPVGLGFNVARPFAYSRQDGVDTPPREGADGVVAADLPQLPHRGDRKIVVGVVQLGPALGCEPVPLGGPSPSVVLPGRGGAGLRIAGLQQGIQVPANARGGDAEPVTDLTGGDGSGFQQELDDRAARCGGRCWMSPPGGSSARCRRHAAPASGRNFTTLL